MSVRKIPGGLPVAFRYTPGVANTAFLEALRDRGVMLGSLCHVCGITYLPARLFCERCFSELSADAECGPEATIESWTVGHVGIDGEPLDENVTVGLLKVDGADTRLVHFLVGVDRPAIGMRVRAVINDDRIGSISDLRGFGPE